uniref:TVAZ2 protein n=1 Tax=Cyanistes caeruleus TaxID=156563 RepID=A0A8C0U1P3_CYACU
MQKILGCRFQFVLFFSPSVASGKAQVQQEPSLQTTEDSGVNISCSHPKKQIEEFNHFYRQIPGRGPEFLALIARGSKVLPDIAGELWVSEDGRSSALWLGWPRRGDAAVYYCAL